MGESLSPLTIFFIEVSETYQARIRYVALLSLSAWVLLLGVSRLSSNSIR